MQEVTARTAPLWRAALADAGLVHVATALDAQPDTGSRRPLAVLTAAREPLETGPLPPGVPWAERVLVARTGGIEIVNVHSPIARSPELAKVRTHEALAAFLADGRAPRVLCGDLNTPRRELPDGDVLTSPPPAPVTCAPSAGMRRSARWSAAS